MSPASRLIDRLSRVKQTAPGRWLACCPAHEDRSPSLSVRELDDGRILIYDFGGCAVEDVLVALGLSMSDLFEKPVAHQFAASHSRVPARDILEALDHEILVAVLILDEIVKHRRASEDQVKRLAQASARVGAARDMVNPAKANKHAA